MRSKGDLHVDMFKVVGERQVMFTVISFYSYIVDRKSKPDFFVITLKIIHKFP